MQEIEAIAAPQTAKIDAEEERTTSNLKTRKQVESRIKILDGRISNHIIKRTRIETEIEAFKTEKSALETRLAMMPKNPKEIIKRRTHLRYLFVQYPSTLQTLADKYYETSANKGLEGHALIESILHEEFGEQYTASPDMAGSMVEPVAEELPEETLSAMALEGPGPFLTSNMELNIESEVLTTLPGSPIEQSVYESGQDESLVLDESPAPGSVAAAYQEEKEEKASKITRRKGHNKSKNIEGEPF